MQRFLFYINSHFGVGHLQRLLPVIRRLDDSRDVRPMLLFDGYPLPALKSLSRTDLVQLPPVGAFLSGSAKEDGAFLAILAERLRRIELFLQSVHVDLVVIEYYPFSRQALNEEVTFLLRAARANATPPVVVSVRDFLSITPDTDMRLLEKFLENECESIAVHSDPEYVKLDVSYGNTAAFKEKVVYTGFIIDEWTGEKARASDADALVVSVGGGRDGDRLIDMFLRALRCGITERVRHMPIRIFRGHIARCY